MNKNIITRENIENMPLSQGNEIFLRKDSIITSLAQDIINEKGIKVIYKDDCEPDNQEKTSYTKNSSQYDINEFPPDQLKQFFYLMLKIRLFEELAKAYKEKDMIPGDFVHVYLGQEAIAAGVCSALKKEDLITSTHRGHGHMIAKGADVSKMFAELLGKSDGYCKGKGGSMHITDISLGILGANGIVGAGLPIATGSALASKLSSDNCVTVAFFGDGASNQGTFGESLNFSKIFSLPIIFLCENNGYAISTPASYSCSTPFIYKRGIGYGIPSELINGNDIFEVYSACKKAVEEIRKNPHPILIEAKTNRRAGHWIGDPQNYRSAEELANLPNLDPLRIFLEKIKSRSDFSNLELDKVMQKVSEEIRQAVIFAENSPYPRPEEAAEDYLKEQKL
ncbi:MAG: thiamine pyrophosphate-dependent dehydrogenase E1 component subunit alpha [Candidatus Humimicrobiaceae bacterium]